ncbi:DUF2867 domain-containing protein [Streptomyces sp. NPDC059443]|uniref:DUF2867 domain-containing protein n=1 Tax=unclassified Streptomyces TaxID=2593676 RepID=UPI003691FE06
MGGTVRRRVSPVVGAAVASLGSYDHVDAVAVDVAAGTSAADFVQLVSTGGPAWVGRLMALRDRLVAPFGLRVQERGKAAETRIEPGVKRGPFRVLSVTQDEVLCGDDDKHLAFRASFAVRAKADGSGSEGVCTTVVRFDRTVGRLYFRAIEPFHHLVVASLLRPRR